MSTQTTTKQDVYTGVTNRIITELEQGVRPWVKPWQNQHGAGCISRPPSAVTASSC